MRVYLDLDLLQLIESPTNRAPVTSIAAKRGTSKFLELQTVRDGERDDLPEGTQIRFGPKEQGKYDGPFIVFCDSWTFNSTTGCWEGYANFNTVALNTLLGSPDGDDANDVASEDLMAEFSWLIPSATNPEKSETFTVSVANSVDNGNEGVPTEDEPAINTRLTAVETNLAPLINNTGTASYSSVHLEVGSASTTGTVHAEGGITVGAVAKESSRTSLGSGITGDSLFTAATAAAARLILGWVGDVLPVSLGGTGRSTKPYCSIEKSLSQTISSSVDTRITFDFPVIDAAEIWSTADNKATMPRDGFVSLTCTISGDVAAWLVRIKINGVLAYTLSGNLTFAINSLATQFPVSTGDEVELWVMQLSGSSKTLGGYNENRLTISYID